MHVNDYQARIQSWTLGEALIVFSCFLNTIAYYRKHCCLGVWSPDPPGSAPDDYPCNIQVINHLMKKVKSSAAYQEL